MSYRIVCDACGEAEVVVGAGLPHGGWTTAVTYRNDAEPLERNLCRHCMAQVLTRPNIGVELTATPPWMRPEQVEVEATDHGEGT